MEWNSSIGMWAKECSSCKTIFKVIANTFADAIQAMLQHFSAGNNGTYDTLFSMCKSCKNARRNHRAIGEQREQLLIQQNGKCGICQLEIVFADKSGARVDHDHETGKTRKVLCAKCNNWMAAVDDAQWLAKAIEYRKQFRCE